MPFPRPFVDIDAPPSDFDALFSWFELVSYNLVLLEEYPLAAVQSACVRAGSALRTHAAGPIGPHPRGLDTLPMREMARLLVADHAWFERSVEQLDWFLGIVQREDHGGHRQALGQYGRILSESVRRHRADERAYLDAVGRGVALSARPSKAK